MASKAIEKMDLQELDAAIGELEARFTAMRRRRRALLLAQANEARAEAAARSDQRVLQIYWEEGGGTYGSLSRTAKRAGLSLRQASRVISRN